VAKPALSFVQSVELQFLFIHFLWLNQRVYRAFIERRRRVTKRGVEVGIADKKWGSNAARGPRTRKSRGSTDPLDLVAPRLLHSLRSMEK